MAVEDVVLERFLAVLNACGKSIPQRFLPKPASFGTRRELVPNRLECLEWLERTEEIASGEGRSMAALLRRERDGLHWGQTYRESDFGTDFLRNYGWLEVFGARGCFEHGEIAGGLLLLGPGTHYPDHHHVAEEIYVPLTGGSAWRMGNGPFMGRGAGEVIHHASDVGHAMRTTAEPLLAVYLWRGGPLDQRSEIGTAG